MASDRRPGRVFRFPWRTPREIGAEVDEEVRFHLEMRAEELARGGTPPDAALARARREFGDVDAARASLARTDERHEHARRRTEWMGELAQDARYAVRALRARPGFTAVAVVTLALGIGANAALFSVVNAVLLRDLPYAEPDRLVSVWPEGAIPLPGLEMVRREAKSFAAVEGYVPVELTLTGQGEPARLEGAKTTPGLFGTLGVAPALGRSFLPGEDAPGRSRVVLLSDALWRQRFGEDPSVVGRAVRLGGESYTVVGVMPPTFRFPSRGTRLWTPAARDPNPFAEWGSSWMTTVARLRPGATVERASAETGAAMARVRGGFPWKMPDDWARGAGAVPLRDQVVGETGPMLLILLGAVGFVMLIACVNVANLLLARAAVRQKEIAIRSALGAGRGRLARQLLTESAVLAALGGAAGLALGAVGVRLLRAALPADTPRLDEIGMDARVLLFTLAVTALTGLLFGALPALRASRTELAGAMAEGGRGGGGGPGRQRVTGALVAAEVALAVVLVTGAGLLVRSFWNLTRVDPGFRVENLVSATVSPPEERYADDASRRALYARLLERLERVPGASAVAAGSMVPLGEGVYGSVFVIEGRPHPNDAGGEWPMAEAAPAVSPEWLRTMRVPLLRGRPLAEADREGAPPVVLVSEGLARKYWPDGDALGKRIMFPGEREEWRTIAGVVGDVRWKGVAAAPEPAMYVPLAQRPTGQVRVVVRTAGDPAAVAASLRGVVAGVAPDAPVSEVATAVQLARASVERPRFAMLLLAVFAGVALVLGAVGIYGVVAYAVSRRTHELGVRMALGARPGDVLRMVLGQGAALAGAGAVAGIGGALLVTRALESLLYGVERTDPLTLLAVPVLLTAVALVASWLPARRATRIDPMLALRGE